MKKARRGRPKTKSRKNNPFLDDEENSLLEKVKPKNKGTILGVLNKRRLSKYELDEVFSGEEGTDEDL